MNNMYIIFQQLHLALIVVRMARMVEYQYMKLWRRNILYMGQCLHRLDQVQWGAKQLAGS
jgi:hypothetical protein